MKTNGLLFAALIYSIFTTIQCVQSHNRTVTLSENICLSGVNQDSTVVKLVHIKQDLAELSKRVKNRPTKIIYKKVYIKEPARPVQYSFKDTSYISVEKDSLISVNLKNVIIPPKSFEVKDPNFYMAGTIELTGLNIDSISIPAKTEYTVQQIGRKNTILITSHNPYLTPIPPIMYKDKTLWQKLFNK